MTDTYDLLQRLLDAANHVSDAERAGLGELAGWESNAILEAADEIARLREVSSIKPAVAAAFTDRVANKLRVGGWATDDEDDFNEDVENAIRGALAEHNLRLADIITPETPK